MTRNEDDSNRRRPRESGETRPTADAGKERLFSMGDDGDVPLAAVFKTRRGPRRSAPPPPPIEPAEPLEVLDVLDEDAVELTDADEGFDVLLTNDFRVSKSSKAPARHEARPGERPATLSDVIPPDADPTWAREAVLAAVAERAGGRDRPDGMWYQELFNSDYLKTELATGAEQVRAEVDFIENALGLPTAGRVLDLGCGFGRHTVPLARRGYDMVGLDLSLDLLKTALRRAQAKKASIKFVHGDIRDLEFDRVFDGVYCFNTTFGYFGETENMLVLRGVHRALKPGGRFLIDVVNRDYAIQSLPVRNWWEGDGCLVQEDVDFDHLTSRLMVKRFLVYADGTQREYDITMRIYGVHELMAMLRLAGFRYVGLSGSLHTPGAFFGVGSERILLTVER